MMDKFTEQFSRYLQLAHSSALLVTKTDKKNLDMLFNLLGPLDRNIIVAAYGLFGSPVMSVEEMAGKYNVSAEVIEKRVAKDLRLLAISPEWQMMVRQLRPVVRKRINAL